MAHRLALTTAAATLVLILFGGLVTNTGAGLAVPDWPTTFGYNMFLFPWSRMLGGVFYEHSHRLIGSVVGLLTVGLAAALWGRGARLRWLGVAAVAAVVLQGVLGGLRVVLLQDTLAIVHGCLAQAFFALVVAIVLLTSPRAEAAEVGPKLRGLTFAAVALTYVQVVLGALLTHAGQIALHLAGALAVFAFVPIVTAQWRRRGDPIGAPAARALLVLLGIQLVLGVGSYLARFGSNALPGEQLTVLVFPVAHRLIASLILGATVVLAVRAGVRSPGLAGTESPVERPGLATS